MKTLILLLSLLIIDSKTNEPLTGVEVISKSNGKSYYTDLNGEVQLPKDSCEYRVNYISYSDTVICGNDTLLKLKER